MTKTASQYGETSGGLGLLIQQVVSYLLFPLLYLLCIFWMKFVRKYQIENIKDIRRQYREICESTPQGLLVCPNHLTFIDSMLLIWAFASPWYYAKHFRRLCWNLPKAAHVKENWLHRVVCYLGKCLLIEKEVSASKQTMIQASALLQKGHHIMVFPEGTRSNTGRINDQNFIYGVGQLHIDSQLPQVLMVYLRGMHQKTATKLPVKGEHFTVEMKLESIQSTQKGRRAMRDVASQMIESLKQLEANYFTQNKD
ncbi:lysophospholipid acyltransferase family protein [Marinicella rhabdoformis]|uniref:lysophospholipid acyltransferase family protein n=1 Tax=Marinicella rhabdoformis TaxID=2580566 RepID=UPI0012AED1F9|nr:lysophospholipid acyltransferase family protein [Marinicella rhabdoformis]